MNNKINAAEVACLITGNEAYDQIFRSLKAALPTDEAMIFAERSTGSGFLQWELPGEGWTSLGQGDPIRESTVKQELERRIQFVRNKFGDNQTMADQILTYPDDSCVFYKTTPEGKLLILLTAWGYLYPERIGGGTATGRMSPEKAGKERITTDIPVPVETSPVDQGNEKNAEDINNNGGPIAVPEAKKNHGGGLPTVLLLLGLGVLVAATYYFGWRIFDGF